MAKSTMTKRKTRRFDDGGLTETADKEAGLKASSGDKVGFFERIRMGNIDDPSSEAYKRFGAGRGRAERVPVEDRTPVPVGNRTSMAAVQDAERSDTKISPVDFGEIRSEDGTLSKLRRNTETGELYNPEGTGSSASSAAKPTTKYKAPQAKSAADRAANRDSYVPLLRTIPSRDSYQKVPAKNAPQESNEERTPAPTVRQRVEAEIDSARPSASQTQKGLEAASMMMGGAGLKSLHQMAKNLAKPKMATYSQPSLPAPTPRLPYDKAGAVNRARDARATARQEEMLTENAARYGLDPKAPGYEAAASAVRKQLGGKDFSFKRGGSVKKMSGGGMTSKPTASSASRRGDGIASKGKTRGRMC